MTLKRIAWTAFWVYQIAGVVLATYYWEEILTHYHLMRTMVEGFLQS